MPGPFQSYAPPGAYTETEFDSSVAGPPAGLQIPAFIGTGKETLSQDDLDLVRGSSASVDQLITRENVTDRFVIDDTNPNNLQLGSVDGQVRQFKVKHFPIVRGDGSGTTTNRPQDVKVLVDGERTPVTSVTGADGLITLQVPPPSDATVRVTYSFNRTDTQQTDDVSEQVTDHAGVIKGDETETYNIVDGSTDTLKLKVNGTNYTITLQPDSTKTALSVVQNIRSANISGLRASVDVDNQGNNRVQLESDGSIEVLDGSANNQLGFVSGQSDDRNDTFYVYDGPIVDGSDGGITTNSSDDVAAFVDGSSVSVAAVDGERQEVRLDQPPAVGSTVEIEYFHNTFQNTFDYLPNDDITAVDRVGDAPGRNDYTQGQDFIIKNGNIYWGANFTIDPSITTPGAEPFDDTEISAKLKADKIWYEEVSRFDSLSISSSLQDAKEIQLGNVPTEGNGKGKPTEDVDKVHIYHGTSLSDARDRGEVELRRIEPQDQKVVVERPIPSDHTIYATYFYNRLRDDTYTITKDASGQITVSSDLRGSNVYNVRFAGSSASDTIEWPSGVETEPDAFASDVDGVAETVTVTFTTTNEEPATLISDSVDPYDIFPNASDTLNLTINDGDHSISNDTFDVDLNQTGFGVVINDGNSSGSTYNATSGNNNNIFRYDLSGTSIEVDLSNASGSAPYTLDEIAEVIWRSAPNETQIKGGSSEPFDLDGTSYDLDINGSNYTGTLSGGSSESASSAESTIESELNSTHGLATGDTATPGNEVDIIANDDNTLSIEGSQDLTVNDSGAGGLENETGWDGGTVPNKYNYGVYSTGSQLNNTKIARTWGVSSGNREYLLLRSQKEDGSNRENTPYIQVIDGNGNSLLGFDNFQIDEAVESAVNKPATLLSGTITSTDISNLEQDEDDFVISVDGSQQTVSGSNFNGVSTLSGLATTLGNNLTGVTVSEVPSGSTAPNKIRITSNSVDSTSALEIGAGAANAHLQFSEGDAASQRKATSDEVATILNNDASAWSNNSSSAGESLGNLPDSGVTGEYVNVGFAEDVDEGGFGDFLELTSFEYGTDVSIQVNSASSDDVLNDTGIGFQDGDAATGFAGEDGFSVSSNQSNGSSGSGIVDQTYVDSNTGLTFTVQSPSDGDYADNDSFTLEVEEKMQVGSAVVNRSIPGIEMYVSNIGPIPTGDTAQFQTYDKGGNEPSIGDFYYITYDYEKNDFSTKLFTRFRDIQNNYGELDPENPLTLASYLSILNGAQIIANKQVQKKSGSQQASQQAYFDALKDLEKPIQGNIKPDIIVPLTTDTQVQSQTVKHVEMQSSKRFRNERRAIFGTSSGTSVQSAKQLANDFDSFRVVLMYPDSAVMTLTDALGNETQHLVDGRYLAAAMAGSAVSPEFDVATPWTRRNLVGFDRLNKTLTDIEKNQLATAGVTVLDETSTNLEVRDGLTTDRDNQITSTPSIIAIHDFVQQQTRNALSQFIGLKNLQGVAQDVETSLSSLLNSLVENDIIVDYGSVSATPDENDPTQLNVEALYSPVFPLKYLNIEFVLTSNSLG